MLVRLANPEHMLPWPGVPGRIVTGDEVVEINENHPFWGACLRDGSLVEVVDSPAPLATSSAPLAPDAARPLAGEPGPAVAKPAKTTA